MIEFFVKSILCRLLRFLFLHVLNVLSYKPLPTQMILVRSGVSNWFYAGHKGSLSWGRGAAKLNFQFILIFYANLFWSLIMHRLEFVKHWNELKLYFSENEREKATKRTQELLQLRGSRNHRYVLIYWATFRYQNHNYYGFSNRG